MFFFFEYYSASFSIVAIIVIILSQLCLKLFNKFLCVFINRVIQKESFYV